MILGLHGKMGAGKNGAARRLALLSPIPVVEVSYARKLKQSVGALFGLTLDEIEELKNADALVWLSPPLWYDGTRGDVRLTFREFLQLYGTEAHREVFGGDFWLDAALPIDGRYSDEKLYAVTDVRFQNEADRVRELGGIVVGIVGPGDVTLTEPAPPKVPKIASPWGGTTLYQPTEDLTDLTPYATPYEQAVEGGKTHASEAGLECDIYIDNTARDNRYSSLDRQLAQVLLDHGVFADQGSMLVAWDATRAYELTKTEGT